jgi:hypothetical protein
MYGLLQLFLKGSKGSILHLGLVTLFLEFFDIAFRLKHSVSKIVSPCVIHDPVTEKKTVFFLFKFPVLSSEDGNRSSLQNVVLLNKR